VGSDEKGRRVGESARKEDAMMAPPTGRTGGGRRGKRRRRRGRSRNLIHNVGRGPVLLDEGGDVVSESGLFFA
jgi:hypothetical protein